MKPFIFSFALSFISFTSIFAQNNSLLFDGVDDKVVVQSTQTPFNLTNFTLEAWINASNWKAQQWQGTIISKDGANQSGYVLRCGNNGRLSFTIGTTSSWPEVVSNPIMQTNAWHHVAAVLDNGTMKIYVDGNLEGSQSGVNITSSSVNLHLGESAGFSGRVFDGRIDEVRIWDTVRSEIEIAANDTVNLPLSTPHLLAYYKFDQTSGTTVPNLTPSANLDGTMINFGGNPWVPGFEPTITDIQTEAILTPNNINFYEGPKKVKAKFSNNGIDTITSFVATYELNGINPVSETVNDIILPGKSIEYIFNTLLLDQDSISELKVFANISGDANPLNDTISASFEDKHSGNTYRIPIFYRKQHNFAGAGQSHVKSVALPENNQEFSKITMRISLNCPSSGCDPWDQPAKISLLKDGQLYELARFITPYGKGCGPWDIDVTDFKTLLKGNCDFVSYIQVWGPSGWLLNVTLNYEKGNVALPYQKIDKLWSTDNWVYGEPSVSHDLPTKSIGINPNTLHTDFRMTISGHGQGNTNNAAEFSNFTHQVFAGGSSFISHNLWKSDCDQNSCSNQFGTWLFSRAGWCPGQGVDPFMVDLTTATTPGQALDVDYELFNYTNFLNTGYNGGSHTQPHYKIHSYLIQKSDQYIDSLPLTNIAAMEITEPAGLIITDANAAVKVMLKNTGSVTIVNPSLRLIVDGNLISTETFTTNIAAGDSAEYTFSNTPVFVVNSNTQITAVVDYSGDEAASDDVVSKNYTSGVGGVAENIKNELILYPNPSHGSFNVKSSNDIRLIEIYSTTGVLLESFEYNQKQVLLNSKLGFGTYIIRISDSEEVNHKMIVIE